MSFGVLKPGRRKFVILAAFLVVALYAVLGDKGLLDVLRLKKEYQGIVEFNMALEKENAELERKISLLKTDNRYIGHIARSELGMIGRNEIIYRIEDDIPTGPSK